VYDKKVGSEIKREAGPIHLVDVHLDVHVHLHVHVYVHDGEGLR